MRIYSVTVMRILQGGGDFIPTCGNYKIKFFSFFIFLFSEIMFLFLFIFTLRIYIGYCITSTTNMEF